MRILFDPKVDLWPFATKVIVSLEMYGTIEMEERAKPLTELTRETKLDALKPQYFEIFANMPLTHFHLRIQSHTIIPNISWYNHDYAYFNLHKIITKSDVTLTGVDMLYFFRPEFDELNYRQISKMLGL